MTLGRDLTAGIPLEEKGAFDGVATLDSAGKVPAAQMPAISITDTFVVASEAAMLALTAQTGDVAIRTDNTTHFILQGTDPTLIGDWVELLTAPAPVTTVHGRIGNVVGVAGDYSGIYGELGSAETVTASWEFSADIKVGNIQIGLTNDNTIDMASGQLILSCASGTMLEIQNSASTVQYQFNMDSAIFAICGAAGTSRTLQWESVGLKRWAQEATSDGETGGDAGSNMRYAAHDDLGVFIDHPFEIERKAGGEIDLRRPVAISGVVNIASASALLTGNLLVRRDSSDITIIGPNSVACIVNNDLTVNNLIPIEFCSLNASSALISSGKIGVRVTDRTVGADDSEIFFAPVIAGVITEIGTISGTGMNIAGALTLSTDLAIAEGGTGASTAATARTNLGLATVSQAEAEAGIATTTRAWTAERVKQAIAALETGGGGLGDNFVFAYDTTTQGIAVANTAQGLDFSNNGQLDGWLHTTSTSTFTCKLAVKYNVRVLINCEKSAGASQTFEAFAEFNGVEVAGSQVGADIPSSSVVAQLTLDFDFVGVVDQDLEILVAGSSTDVDILPGPSPTTATALTSATINITRVD